MGNVGNVRCNETIMKTLEDIIRRISPFAAAVKMMHEVEQEEIRRSKRQKRAALSIHMIFDINNRTRDQRRYNLPRANEVAAIFVGENGDIRNIGMWLFTRLAKTFKRFLSFIPTVIQ